MRLGSISTANGSALVRMGNTTIVCGVKAEISEPELDHDGDGFLGNSLFFFFATTPSFDILTGFVKKKKKKVPNLDLPAMCSPSFKPGPPTEKAQVLSDRLNQVLTTSVLLLLVLLFKIFGLTFFYPN